MLRIDFRPASVDTNKRRPTDGREREKARSLFLVWGVGADAPPDSAEAATGREEFEAVALQEINAVYVHVPE